MSKSTGLIATRSFDHGLVSKKQGQAITEADMARLSPGEVDHLRRIAQVIGPRPEPKAKEQPAPRRRAPAPPPPPPPPPPPSEAGEG